MEGANGLKEGDDKEQEEGRQRRLVVQKLHGVDLQLMLLLPDPLGTKVTVFEIINSRHA